MLWPSGGVITRCNRLFSGTACHVLPTISSFRSEGNIKVSIKVTPGISVTKSQQSCLPVSLISRHPGSPEMTLGMAKPPVEPWCVAVAPVSREVQGPDAGEACSSRSQVTSRGRRLTGFPSFLYSLFLFRLSQAAQTLQTNLPNANTRFQDARLYCHVHVSYSGDMAIINFTVF